jgi:hypothetical protein
MKPVDISVITALVKIVQIAPPNIAMELCACQIVRKVQASLIALDAIVSLLKNVVHLHAMLIPLYVIQHAVLCIHLDITQRVAIVKTTLTVSQAHAQIIHAPIVLLQE